MEQSDLLLEMSKLTYDLAKAQQEFAKTLSSEELADFRKINQIQNVANDWTIELIKKIEGKINSQN